MFSTHRTMDDSLRLHTNLNSADRVDRVVETAEFVGLRRDQLDAYPAELSSGEQQRVAIGRAIVTRPDFIVLDEPISCLAPVAQIEILQLLVNLQEQLGISYVYISHDLSTVESLCHRVAVMYLSQIVEMGSTAQVFGHALHPYSRCLLASVLLPDPSRRRLDRDVGYELEGEIPSPIDLPSGCYLASRCPVALPVCQEMSQELRDLGDGHEVRCWRVKPSGELKDEPDV
jgi:oligopeptide/dipeptide ABC transporter ATP-binding protein